MAHHIHATALWVPMFLSAVDTQLQMAPGPLTFQFATVDADGSPHVRTCVYRGWLFDTKGTNVPTFTTDTRMAKAEQLAANDRFEAVFYFPAANKQVRMRGRARMLTRDTYPQVVLPRYLTQETDGEGSAVTHLRRLSRDAAGEPAAPPEPPVVYPLVLPAAASHVTKTQESHSHLFTHLADLPLQLLPPLKEEWTREWLRQWGKLSRAMRDSFRKPAPGAPLDEEKLQLLDKISRGVDGGGVEAGKKNFAVVCLFVEAVDIVKFGGSRDHRWVATRDPESDTWAEQEVCP